MTGIGILGNGVFCVVLVGILNVSIAVVAHGTYGPIMNQRVGIRTEKRPVEEALLNFSIEEVSGGGLRTACASAVTRTEIRDYWIHNYLHPTSGNIGIRPIS